MEPMMTWESLTSKDLRFSRGILDLRDVTETSEVEGPHRRCSKEWATWGRNSSKGPRLVSCSHSVMQSNTTRLDGMGGREWMLRNLHRRKSGAFRHSVSSEEDRWVGKQEISTSRRIGKSRGPITASNTSGTASLSAIKVILCQRFAQGMIKSPITSWASA